MAKLSDVAAKVADREARLAERLAAWKRPRTKAAREKARAERVAEARAWMREGSR